MEVIVADAGVIIATLDADDARHQESRAVLAVAWADRLSLVVPAVAYAESMVVTADERWAGLDVGVRVRVIGAD